MDIDKLTVSLKLHEGLRNFLYTDTTGHVTGGYGHNFSARGISNAAAEFILREDIQSVLGAAEAQSWWHLVKDNDARSRAFTELVFNIGTGGVAGFRDAMACAMQGDWAGCAEGFRQSVWFSQVGNRAETICFMIQFDADPEPADNSVS